MSAVYIQSVLGIDIQASPAISCMGSRHDGRVKKVRRVE
jgi:hypothetical protein